MEMEKVTLLRLKVIALRAKFGFVTLLAKTEDMFVSLAFHVMFLPAIELSMINPR